ncbi:MAG: hypothetical protein GXY13_03180 [Acidimicrobiales bacterium]|nr:hypothetical protein [Acidimicrobiales bacterium]
MSITANAKARQATALLEADGAPATPDAVAFASSYLSRRSSLRWACALFAVVAVNVLGFVLRDEPVISLDLFPIMGAYAVGTVIAEVRLARARGAVARASLVARTVDRYLGPEWLPVQRTATAAAVLLMGGAALVNTDPGASRVEPVLYAVAALLVGVGAEWAQRRIVDRAQTASEPDLVAADDAVRASSVRAVAGVAIAFLVMTAGGGAAHLVDHPVPALIGVGLGLFLWYRCVRPKGAAYRILLVAVSLLAVVGVAATVAIVLARSNSVSESQPAVPVTQQADEVEPGTTEPGGTTVPVGPTTTTER